MGRILLAEHILNLRLVIIAIVYYLNGHSLPPIRDQLQRLLADLLDMGQVKIIARNNETEVNKVAQAFGDARFVEVAHTDPVATILKHRQILLDFHELGHEELGIAQIRHKELALVLNQVANFQQLFNLALVA